MLPKREILSHIGIVFTMLYAVFVGIVYFTELTVVIPAMLRGTSGDVVLLRFTGGSFMAGLDAPGYFTMGMATLFAAPVFMGDDSSAGRGGHFLPMGFWVRSFSWCR